MSKLTQRMMLGIDYEAAAYCRRANYKILQEALGKENSLELQLDDDAVPMVYPYFVENGALLRQYLIDHKVFCASYWPNVLEWCKLGDWEYQLAENLVCLPIDQRYWEEEMNSILETTHNFL